MAAATGKVAHGDMDIDLSDIHRQDEVGQLAHSLTTMAQELKKYIDELTITSAAKQRFESELSIAAGIQKSMLPSVFPPFPDRDEFDIYALMRPAKEVGGDFYDFSFLDDDHLMFVVGDVSGKGVPAALFMSVTKYLIEAAVVMDKAPDKDLSRVSRHLADDNESCMFVTVFIGILNVKSGEFLYASAGHNPLLLWSNDSDPSFLEGQGGPVVGIVEEAVFGMDHLTLRPGSVLLAHTDGVTEAFNTEEEAFSEERLLRAINPVRNKPVKDVVEGILADIDSFSVGAPQADDITILALRYGP
ncbi:MAG: SpoIIE family protein phosphatase [Desulfomonilaceae bacterium]